MAGCTKVEAKESGEFFPALAAHNGSRISDLNAYSRAQTSRENIVIIDVCVRFCTRGRIVGTVPSASFSVSGKFSSRRFPSDASANRYAAGLSRRADSGDRTKVTKLEERLVTFLIRIHEGDATLNIMFWG